MNKQGFSGNFTPIPGRMAGLFWGKFSKLLRSPGLSWVNLWGRKVIKISTKKQAIDIPRSVVADGNANPILVAGVVTYRFVDSIKAALEVEDAEGYVKTQALAVLKQVCSRYPYESKEGESLKSEAEEIGLEMVTLLQSKVEAAGAEVLAFELSDLTYAPEIAGAMLQRQQAAAVVAARKQIVDGAVGMVDMALQGLAKKGIVELDEERKAAMVSNLLVVLCGDRAPHPVVNTGTLYT